MHVTTEGESLADRPPIAYSDFYDREKCVTGVQAQTTYVRLTSVASLRLRLDCDLKAGHMKL
jgi:hypothetical protein